MAATTADTTIGTTEHRFADPVTQAHALLRVGFTVAPILFGLDKFLDWLVEWQLYLAPRSTTWCQATPTRRCSPSA
jgi:hypothetical protein